LALAGLAGVGPAFAPFGGLSAGKAMAGLKRFSPRRARRHRGQDRAGAGLGLLAARGFIRGTVGVRGMDY